MQTNRYSSEQYCIRTLFISFGTIGKEVFAGKVEAVPMEIVRLEEP